MVQYLDFDLEILEKGKGRSYEAHVLRSPAGEARATFTLPFDRKDLDLVRASIEKAVLRRIAAKAARRLPTPEVAQVREFGEKLFASLVVNGVRDCYIRSCHEAQKQGCGLRLKLRLPPALGQVPWEFLYSRSDGDFLNLSIYRPIVRYLELPHLPVESLCVPAPLRLLAVIASPKSQRLASLDIAREKRVLQGALAPLVQRSLVALDFLEGPDTFRQLNRCLRRETYHVLHFVGHGGYDEETQEGVLVMENEQRGEALVGSENLGRLLRDVPCTRLVFLNACQGTVISEADPFSSLAGALVRAGVPAVVAMQFEITDAAAILLAQEFYTALADNLPVDAALAEARKQIAFEDPDSLEWATPVLYMRAPDGVLFQMTSPTPKELPASQKTVEAERRRQEELAVPAQKAEVTPPAPPKRPAKIIPVAIKEISYNTADIRQFLTEAFSDEDLAILSYDYFRSVYDGFTLGMTKGQKIQLLIEYCQGRNVIPNLLAAIQKARPDQYEKRFKVPAVEIRPEPPRPKRDPRQVFISHAHEDTDFAHRLAADLREPGWHVWIVPDSIQPGEKWVEAINRGLAESSVFILVLTPAAVSSPWVKSETNVAIELQHKDYLRLVPLYVEHCDVPPLWNIYQRVSFLGQYEDGLAALLVELEPTDLLEQEHQEREARDKTAKEEAKREAREKPAPAPPTTPPVTPPPSVPRAELDKLYTEALIAYHLGKWAEAVAGFQAVVNAQPDYEDAADRLAQARLPMQLAEQTAREQAQRQEHKLAALYSQGRKALDDKQWAEAAARFSQIVSVDPGYRQAAQLLALAEAQAFPLRLIRPLDGQEMVLIPAGEFLMGSTDEEVARWNKEAGGQYYDDEKPQHKVSLAAYYVDHTPITNAQYQKFVVATKRQAPSHWKSGKIPAGLENHPVVNVSWHDAVAYSQWLNEQLHVPGSTFQVQRSGRQEAWNVELGTWNIRLPTEAEWEKAARDADGRHWPWGNEFNPQRCNSSEGSKGTTTPVGAYSPAGDSPYGVADMAGNVWEWCRSLYKPYPYQADDGREDPQAAGTRVLRGGSWNYDRRYARCAARGGDYPGGFPYNVGFRVVFSPN